MVWVPFYSGDYGHSGRCPNCHRNVAETEDYCAKCGLPLRKKCAFCGSLNELNSVRCNNCHKPLPPINEKGLEVEKSYKRSLKLIRVFSLPGLILAAISVILFPFGLGGFGGNSFGVSEVLCILGLSFSTIGLVFGILSHKHLTGKFAYTLAIIGIVAYLIIVFLNVF